MELAPVRSMKTVDSGLSFHSTSPITFLAGMRAPLIGLTSAIATGPYLANRDWISTYIAPASAG